MYQLKQPKVFLNQDGSCLVNNEHTAKEIAQKLFISNHTAISHRQNLMSKLDVRNTAGLVRRAFELGLISLTG